MRSVVYICTSNERSYRIQSVVGYNPVDLPFFVFSDGAVNNGTFGDRMLMLYLKSAIRGFRRRFANTAISVAGLAIGIAASIAVGAYVQFVLSHDQFHPNVDRIHRITGVVQVGNSAQSTSSMPSRLGPALAESIPEVKASVRLSRRENLLLRTGETQQALAASKFLFADSSFAQVFRFDVHAGNLQDVFDDPSSLAVTEKAASRMALGDDPIGAAVEVEDGHTFRVEAVLENPPPQSSIQFRYVAPFNALKRSLDSAAQGWSQLAYPTYVQLASGAEASQVADEIEQFADTRTDALLLQNITFSLEPLTDVYFSSVPNQLGEQGDWNTVLVFIAVGFLVLFAAVANYVNLSTAQSAGRSRETGVRRAIGGSRIELIGQFLAESTLTSGGALLLAAPLVFAILPYLDSFVDAELSRHLLYNPTLIIGAVAGTVLLGVLSGFYPAVVLSRYQPADVLQGRQTTASAGALVRRCLVVVQFVIAVVLIVGTITTFRQLDYLQRKDLGIEDERVVLIPLEQGGKVQASALKKEWERRSSVANVSLVSAMFPRATTVQTYDLPGQTQSIEAAHIAADPNFLQVLGIDFLQARDAIVRARAEGDSIGRGLTQAVVVNKTMARRLSEESVLGHSLSSSASDRPVSISGIIEDFHFQSLRTEIDPLVITLTQDPEPQYAVIQLRPTGSVDSALSDVKDVWTRVTGGLPFNYSFLDTAFESLYQSESRLAWLLSGFALLSVFVTGLGLFGLAVFTVQRRTQEIGVRKALGASSRSIVGLFLKEFGLLVGVGFILAVPLSYWAISQWLQNFAYSISPGINIYLIALTSVSAAVLIAVGAQVLQATRIDPATSLRRE